MSNSTGGGGGPQGELQLLERVFFRLGMAETDEQLQVSNNQIHMFAGFFSLEY